MSDDADAPAEGAADEPPERAAGAAPGGAAGAPHEGVPVTGVSELVLEVVDLEAAEAFYAGVLGLPVVERWPDREAIWVMAGDRTRIGLWRPQVGLAGGRGGLHVHFAMHIAEPDYDAAVALLRERREAVEEIAFDGAGRAAYVTDPDGNVVELWTWDVAEHLR
jgi:catechol 2,3-dioxygenase-like lactoylglutathione lyase family enzyme